MAKVGGDAGAQLLLAEAEARLKAARAQRTVDPGDGASAPRIAGVGSLFAGLVRAARRLVAAITRPRRICVE